MVFAIHRHESTMGAHVSHHPEPPSHLPPHPVPLGCLRAPALSALLHHWTCAGHLFYIWWYTCFSAVLSYCPTLAFSSIVQKSVLYICVSFAVLHMGHRYPLSKLIDFSWRIITLQYCDGFCHISVWIGHRYTCVLSPLGIPTPTPYLWVFPEHQLWVPCFMHRTCTGHLFYIW